jgi:hypothetical protein
MLPASAAVHGQIRSDSCSSRAQGYSTYEQQLNKRKRLRMSARPILQLICIYRLMHQRKTAGGSIKLSLVKAHIDNTTSPAQNRNLKNS